MLPFSGKPVSSAPPRNGGDAGGKPPSPSANFARQARQRRLLALLLPALVLVTAVVVIVAMLPEPPPFAVLLALGGAIWTPLALLTLRAFRPALADAPLARYLANAFLVALEILIFWAVLRSRVQLLEQLDDYWFTPLLYGLLLFPLARILTAYLLAHPDAPKSLKVLHIWLLAARPMVLFFSIALVAAGVFLEMHEIQPAINPTAPLALIWPLSALGILWALYRALAQTAFLLRH